MRTILCLPPPLEDDVGGGGGGGLGIFIGEVSAGKLDPGIFVLISEPREPVVIEGLELPEAAALPEIADKARGVFRAALSNSPLVVFGT